MTFVVLINDLDSLNWYRLWLVSLWVALYIYIYLFKISVKLVSKWPRPRYLCTVVESRRTYVLCFW